MAQQQEDDKTLDLIEVEAAAKAKADEMLASVIEDGHLAAEHGLIKVPAYIRDVKKAEKKTKNNINQEDFVKRKEEKGLKKDFCPVLFSSEVKTKFGGDWDVWLQSKISEATLTVPEKIVEKVVEKPVEIIKVVPAALSSDQKMILDKVGKLRGWRKKVFDLL